MCLYLHLPEKKKKRASCFLIQVPKLHDLAWEQRVHSAWGAQQV